MTPYLLIKGFLPVVECDELNASTLANQTHDNVLSEGLSRGAWGYTLRKTTRQNNGKFEYPDLAWRIHTRIQEQLSIVGAAENPSGIINTIMYKGGDVFLHVDPNVNRIKTGATTEILRCNILTQPAEKGCVCTVNGVAVPEWSDKGDMLCYIVSTLPHEVSLNEGDSPRILWLFGWDVEPAHGYAITVTKR